MDRPPLEVADLVRAAGDAFIERSHKWITWKHVKVLLAIARCRTAALGGHLDECTRCGHRVISYNSCRNRHCPKCPAGARERWLEKRRRELLPTPYVHVVFTLPRHLAPLVLQNKKVIYDLLFRTSAETLLEVARDPQHLGAEIGFFSVLHSWSQKLELHPHVHCVVPAGGLSVSNAKGSVPFVIEANLTQDHHGNISATGSVTANGPAGNVSDVFIFGTSLSFVNGIAVDYLGFTCNGTDSGDRSITGTVNSSNQVTLNQNDGGTAVVTITGTLDNSATPPFTGTLTSSGICGGNPTLTVTGQYSISLTGNYSGTSAADNTENIVTAITNTNGSLTGDGTDSKLGNFTLTGNAVGNAFSATLTYSRGPGNSGPVFGYYDMKLGARGSILLVSPLGANATSCPNGEPRYNTSCLIAILARQ